MFPFFKRYAKLWSATQSGCGVTANMSALGADDSGFESQHPDTVLKFEYKNPCLDIRGISKAQRDRNHCKYLLYCTHYAATTNSTKIWERSLSAWDFDSSCDHYHYSRRIYF